MNFRIISENDLADFAANVALLLDGSELASIDNSVRSALFTAIGSLPATLATQAADAAIAEGARKARVSERNATRKQIRALMGQVRDALKAGLAPKKEYDLCGFDYPAERSTYEAQSPTNLSAFGYSNGINKIRFSGNNRPGRVVYEIWRRHGDTADWGLHATTKRQSHTDTGITPGQYYEYKVRAVAAKSVSHFSNSAVVYGVS